MFKWGRMREGSVKPPEPSGPQQVLCYKTFGNEERFGKCPVCDALEKAQATGDKALQTLAKRMRATTYEIYQIIDLNEAVGGKPYTPQVLFASSNVYNQLRAILNKTAAHGFVWDPEQGSAIEIDFAPGERPMDNSYTVRCETNLLLPDGDFRSELPPVDGERVISIETGVYSAMLSHDAMAELMAHGDILKAKKAGGVINLATGEVEAVKFGHDTAEAVDPTKRIQFFNLKAGINRIRILPPVEDEGVISVEIKRHFEVNLLPQLVGGKVTELPPERFKSRAELEETRGMREGLKDTPAVTKPAASVAPPVAPKAKPAPAPKAKPAPAVKEPPTQAEEPAQAEPEKPAPAKPAPAPAASSGKQRAMDLINQIKAKKQQV